MNLAAQCVSGIFTHWEASGSTSKVRKALLRIRELTIECNDARSSPFTSPLRFPRPKGKETLQRTVLGRRVHAVPVLRRRADTCMQGWRVQALGRGAEAELSRPLLLSVVCRPFKH